ncbi:MAG: hypothetical protein AAF471_07530, partial [Myxococcota bacterium]
MKDIRKARWLAGCGFVGLLCVSCGVGTPKSPTGTESGLEDQQNQEPGKGNAGLGGNAAKAGALPKACGDITDESFSDNTGVFGYVDGTCQEKSGLSDK